MERFKKNKSDEIKFFPLGLEELRKLSETDSGVVLRRDCRCRLKLNYTILPVYSKHFKNSILQELNKRVLKYNYDLNDMILKCTNIKVITPIEANRCRKLIITCIADIFVFKPRCDSILTAVVNKKSKNHIGCLIYGVFNVSIIKPTELPYNQWPGRHIDVNDIVTFKVIKVDVSEVIPYIIGELQVDSMDTNTSRESYEIDSVISATSEDSETAKKTQSRKRKHADIAIGVTSEEICTETKKDTKLRKRKHSDVSNEEKQKRRKLA